MIHILLYSGGVESILCLKMLRDKGITPFLFHFRTKKLKPKHEKMIRRTAKLLSPKSPLYIFETKTDDYLASYSTNGEYHVHLNKRGTTMMMQKYGDVIIVGYTGYDSMDGRRKLRTHFHGSGFLKRQFLFPLLGKRKSKISNLFKQLSDEVRQNTVSSTKFYRGDWAVVHPITKT